jgi:hypothetical protein
MTAIRIRTYSVVLPINQQVAPEAAEPAGALDDNVIVDANASRLGESSGHLVRTDTSRGEPVKSERIPARSPQTSPIFAQKISGLFLPRKRGEPPALTMLRATPFPAPASHRKRPRDKKGAPKRTLGRIESLVMPIMPTRGQQSIGPQLGRASWAGARRTGFCSVQSGFNEISRSVVPVGHRATLNLEAPKSSVYGLTLASGHIRAGMVTHADLAALHEARCQYVVARIVQRHLLIGIKARHG